MLKLEDVQTRMHCQGWEMNIKGNTLESLVRWGIPADKKRLIRAYSKGLKRLLREAEDKGAFEVMGGAIHGNVNSAKEKYYKLRDSLYEADVCKIGDGASFFVTSYVDGSYSVVVRD